MARSNLFDDGLLIVKEDELDNGIEIYTIQIPKGKRREVKKRLSRYLKNYVWGGEIIEDEAYGLCRDVLSKTGIDLETLLKSRGRPKKTSKKIDPKDSAQKDRGDLMELIGYLIEKDHFGIHEDFIFARNINQKTMSGVSLPGIDGLSIFIKNRTNYGLGKDDCLTICEWKHTTTKNLDRTFSDCMDFLLKSMNLEILFQELKVISRLLRKQFGDIVASKVILFLREVGTESKPSEKVESRILVGFDESVGEIKSKSSTTFH